MDIQKYLDDKRAMVEAALDAYMLRVDGPLADHIAAMRYSLFAGGKRARPVLCLATAEAVHGNPRNLLPVACALECIHTYSLIHDDLPAMDDDDLRRGKPASHKKFGEAAAILAGDGLLSFAFELMSLPEPDNQIAPQDMVRIINIVARAIGPRGMVGGQALDVAAEGREISLDRLRLIHSLKTGALITAAVQAGAIGGQATAAQFEALTAYGRNVGLAFQVVDDLLDVESTTEQLGKAAGSDAERQKATYPAFLGVEGAREKAREAVDAAVASLALFGEQAEPLRQLARYIYTRKK